MKITGDGRALWQRELRELAELIDKRIKSATEKAGAPFVMIVKVDQIAQTISNVDQALQNAMLRELLARREADAPPPSPIEQVTGALIDDGALIEAGWIALRKVAIPADAPAVQIEEMRNAFFAGAQHVFASVMTTLDPGDEPTERDLERISRIDDELKRFINDYSLRRLPVQGRS